MATQTQTSPDIRTTDAVRSKAVEYELHSSEPQVHALVLEYDEIAPLAYEFWQQRGCPEGSPEEDWLRAEQELITRKHLGNISHAHA